MSSSVRPIRRPSGKSRGGMRRVGRVLLSVFVVAAAVVGVTVAAPAPPASAATVRTVSSAAVDDVIAAANASARPGCGLSPDRLAAMLLAPVFHETGAVWTPTTSPSPMTLGRWDDQAALYAFGNKASGYTRAFWHAGVGMWQFDSAGGWNMTAADAISTQTSSAQAAATMAARYCASTAANPVDRMKFAWSLWYACASGGRNVCVDRFNEMYVNGTFTNIRRDPGVGRFGGAVPTTCRIGPTDQVACLRVDPALAQGNRVFAAPGGGPTPLTAPFYVFARNGREYRYWLSQDSGYAQTVIAHKPITSNARSSLTWAFAGPLDGLCDLGAGRGACGTPRVAKTPWGDRIADPFGSLDVVRSGAGAVEVAGWAIDPDTSNAIDVHVYVDGGWGTATKANVVRPDVGAAIPGYGDRHGYSTRIANVAPGARQVCAYAINVGPFGSTNPLLGCRQVVVSAAPRGSLDLVELRPGRVLVSGWASDADGAGPTEVRVSVDGAAPTTLTTGVPRADVARAVPAAGPTAGFAGEVSLGVATGNRRVCVSAVDVPTGEQVQLRCSTVAIPATHLLGSLDEVRVEPGGVRVRGWLTDWTRAAPVAFRVLANGRQVGSGVATASRPDVAFAWRGFGDQRGVDVAIPLGAGRNEVCLVATGVGPGAGEVPLGCRSVTVLSGDPFGSLDLVAAVPGQVRVAGWAIDPDVVDPVVMHVYVGGAYAGEVLASTQRNDVRRVWPAYGAARGFDATLAVPGRSGPTEVCVFAINAGPGTANPLVGCRTVALLSGNPFGSLDVVGAAPGQVRVAGWAIDPDVVDPIVMHVYIGGAFAGEVPATARRSDVRRVWPAYGVRRGFDATLAVPGRRGPTEVCVFAINVGPGTANPLFGCRVVEVPPGS